MENLKPTLAVTHFSTNIPLPLVSCTCCILHVVKNYFTLGLVTCIGFPAFHAVGGLIEVMERVVRDDGVGHCSTGAAIIRPPGHHSCGRYGETSGFCLFNNVAASVNVIRKKHPSIKKVLIVDWYCVAVVFRYLECS